MGIEGLKVSYKGSQSYLNKEEKEAVMSWLKEQKYWDLSELECYLREKYDVVFKSKSSYYELLSEAKVSWQKAQKKEPEERPRGSEEEKSGNQVKIRRNYGKNQINPLSSLKT